ncbi:permease [Asanoa sp. WMMD1127]|uniref:SCO7613 C-terminal domain-containing membrane protein n=1 Tax=Asanoa sp. WMMD1127 TaxID=3016107 RepID=UPI002417971F|nr:permease [Asanoa sp. WMMD1127]MDG4820966.1 permease [Asanoa sp. WMMD1127]
MSRIEREISEIRRKDIQLVREQRLLAQRMQAAQFQRDILNAANQERLKEQIKKPRKVLRKRVFRRPPTADPTGPRIPRQQPAGGTPPTPEPPPPPRVQDLDDDGVREEASTREIQNVYLGLGALLLGVAAVVFAGVTPYAIPRLVILAGAAALMLGVAPFVRARRLSSTAETISAVGLVLVPLIGYAFWLVPDVRVGPVPGDVFAGIVFAVTAAIAAVYASATGLSVPRYGTVLALQPVIPLLTHRWIEGPTGWAFSLAAVAALDIWLGRQYAAFGALVPPAWSARLVPPADEPPPTAAGRFWRRADGSGADGSATVAEPSRRTDAPAGDSPAAGGRFWRRSEGPADVGPISGKRGTTGRAWRRSDDATDEPATGGPSGAVPATGGPKVSRIVSSPIPPKQRTDEAPAEPTGKAATEPAGGPDQGPTAGPTPETAATPKEGAAAGPTPNAGATPTKAADAGPTPEAAPTPKDAAEPRRRPEGAAEEDEVLIDAGPVDAPVSGPPPQTEVAARWLREMSWVLFGIAIGAALIYAVAGLVDARTLPAATVAGIALVTAAGVGLIGSMSLRHRPLPDVAGGIMTLAIVGAAGRVAAVAMPGHALVVMAAIIVLIGFAIRALPDDARKGPQLASTAALLVIGMVVAGNTLRAAIAPIDAALPMWGADLTAYDARLDAAIGSAQWQLAVAAALLTVAAVLAAPAEIRRELAVAGAALTALAAPASFDLSWAAAPWPPAIAAIAIGVAGLWARTPRAGAAHAVGAALVGLAAAGASAARPSLSAAVLFVIAASGALIAAAARSAPLRSQNAGAEPVGEWAAGGAAFAFPGAVASFVAATVPANAATVPILATAFLAVCATLSFAALNQVAERQLSVPLTAGTGLGAITVAITAFAASQSTVADKLVGALMLVAAVLLFLAPSIDHGRRADRMLDGADFASAAATTALIGALARIAAILAPGGEIATVAAMILVVAIVVRALPEGWRRGPALGIAVGGGVIAAIAGYQCLAGGLRILATPGALWSADLSQWPGSTDAGGAWQAPVALVLLAGAAAIVLPRPWSYDVAAVFVGLATIGAPAALGLPWYSPIIVGGAVATIYGVAAVMAADPRAGLARIWVAAAVALHAVGASVVRPWTTAAALAIIVLIGGVVAALAGNVVATPPGEPREPVATGGGTGATTESSGYPGAEAAPPVGAERIVVDNGVGVGAGAATATMTRPRPTPTGAAVAAPAEVAAAPPHLSTIGGLALGGALLALPGALAGFAASMGSSAVVVLTAALAGSSLGMAVLAASRTRMAPFLSYASVGLAGGATVTAGTALATNVSPGVYAAGAAMLGILAELLRSTAPPSGEIDSARRWSAAGSGLWRRVPGGFGRRWSLDPAMGALLLAVPGVLFALYALGPALIAALIDPLQVLNGVWEGPPAALLDPPPGAVEPSNVLAALLLTLAAGLAALAFSGGRPLRAVPVALPGIAVTILITPVSLGYGWPHSTRAALAVFAVAMLGLALTPPPPESELAQSLRTARIATFVIGLAAGNAGLVGSLATRAMTLLTLGSAVLVGAIAALYGRTERSRILGWLFAAIMGQAFVLTVGLVGGLPRTTSAFGVLAVGAALLIGAALLPRLRRPEASREATTVEWSGYAGGLIAFALAFDSRPHLAGLLAAWGAVLGVAAGRPGRQASRRRVIFYTALGCEVAAWWLLMDLAEVRLLEAYTLPFAAVALVAGLIELRQRPSLGSWVAYGPALVAAFLPTTVIVLIGDTTDTRELLLLVGAAATLVFGSMVKQQAPFIVGAVVTAISAIHFTVTRVGPYYVVLPIGVILLILGASNENRRRAQERIRSLGRMR